MAPPPPRSRWWYGPLSLILMLALCAAALEVAARAYWRLGYQLSFRHPAHPLFAYYPELKAVDETRPRRGDGYYNVLMLGESVLHHAWGEVEPALAEALARDGVRNARIFNLAVPAHTSRDSWLKYASMAGAQFDLVMLYDGANETRTNNAPPEIFRDDYSHYSWYAVVNALAPHEGRAAFALPYTLAFARARLRQRLAPDRFVPTNEPRPEWVAFGGTVRSAGSFERNVTSIVDAAARRGDPVMLMTFASWVPPDYSKEAFAAKRLDYGLHKMPVETWGRPDNVARALRMHNDVIRRLASTRAGVWFVDEAALVSGTGRNFDDPFHLTIAGSIVFAENVMRVLRPHLPKVHG